MTRDEAINRLWGKQYPGGVALTQDGWRHQAALLVDQLSALGLLKLDEPKTAWQRFNVIVADWVDPVERDEFFSDFRRAGLKIVEADR